MKTEYTNTDIDNIIDNLELHLSKVDRFEDTQYFDSYFEFVKYFENIEIIDYHSLVISYYFTYGWMPTILKKFNMEDDITKPISVFNKVKNNIDINDEEYMNLIKCVNNSIVGVSKLLHFINPIEYPIFDSRIKNYFKENDLVESIWKPTYQNKNKDIQQYITYRNICLDIINNHRFNKVYEESLMKLGISKSLTKMRVLENLFFTFGKNDTNKSIIKSGVYIVTLNNTELISVNRGDKRVEEKSIKVNKDNYKVGKCIDFHKRRLNYYKTFGEENVNFKILYETNDYSKVEKKILSKLDDYRIKGKSGRKNEWLENISYNEVISIMNEVFDELE